jgi:hypothetical protein
VGPSAMLGISTVDTASRACLAGDSMIARGLTFRSPKEIIMYQLLPARD